MQEEKSENLKNMVEHINGEIELLEELKNKTLESIDTFNGKNEKGKIIKLELFTILQGNDSRALCYKMYHNIDTPDSDLIDSIRKYFDKRLLNIKESLDSLKEEKNIILRKIGN